MANQPSAVFLANPYRKFLLSTLLMFSFLLTLGLFSVWLCLHHLRDNWSATQILRQTEGRPYIYGPGYSQHGSYMFKLEMLRHTPSNVVAIGSSRVFQFRDYSFRPSTNFHSFYNAGGPALSLIRMLEFAETLQPPYPKVVIVGVDTWGLAKKNPLIDWLADHGFFPILLYGNRFYHWCGDIKTSFANYQNFILEFPRWAPLLKSNTNSLPDSSPLYIGMAAHFTHSGFRNDGSYQEEIARRWIQFPKELKDWFIFEREITTQLYQDKKRPFVNWTGMGSAQKHIFERLVDLLQKKGIKIVFILPPYSDFVMERFDANPQLKNTFTDVKAYFGGLAAQNSAISFHDFTYLSSAGCNPDELLNHDHASEKCYAKISISLEKDPQVGPYIDGDRIRAYLGKSTNPWYIYPPIAPPLGN